MSSGQGPVDRARVLHQRPLHPGDLPMTGNQNAQGPPARPVPFARRETHDSVVEMMSGEPKGTVLDVPAGSGALADRLRKIGYKMCCCDINPSHFVVHDLAIDRGDLNHTLPYTDGFFDYVVCLDGIEHTENPSNAIREFWRILKRGGKLIVSTPNFLNIERRLRFVLTGSHSRIPTHESIREIWGGDLSMAHLSPLGYPLLKFIMEHYGFRILRVETDRNKPRMKWLLPAVWLVRLFGFFSSRERWESYRLSETLSQKIILGGNTLIVMAEKPA
jgi:SAM-dependent methyltransferase